MTGNATKQAEKADTPPPKPPGSRAFAASLRKIEENRDRATLIGNAVGAAMAFTKANGVLFAQAVFEELQKPAKKREQSRLVQYMTMALKAGAASLAYERFRFDAAKKAMECLGDLQQINEEGGDEEEKIEKAIAVLFGERPENTTFESASGLDPSTSAGPGLDETGEESV